MHYKMIVLELLENTVPEIHEKLRSKRLVLQTMERYAEELKICHDDRKTDLWRRKPHSDEIQINSEALELAMADIQSSLLQEFRVEETETLPLDGAMEFHRRHTPPA